MDGLTNIIAKITEQNDAECLSVLDSARARAEEILNRARMQAEEQRAEIEAETASMIAVARAKAVSGAELEYKRAVLNKKSEILDSAVESALESIENSPDEVYCGYIEKLLLSNALCGEGRIVMSKKDLSRLPSGFVENVNKKLGQTKKLSLCDRTIDEAGFVIEYDEMRVDCTFKSLVEDKADEIRDCLSEILFA